VGITVYPGRGRGTTHHALRRYMVMRSCTYTLATSRMGWSRTWHRPGTLRERSLLDLPIT